MSQRDGNGKTLTGFGGSVRFHGLTIAAFAGGIATPHEDAEGREGKKRVVLK